LGRRWMGLEFDTRGRRRDPEQNVWGMETWSGYGGGMGEKFEQEEGSEEEGEG
jgi:hypothetical protein